MSASRVNSISASRNPVRDRCLASGCQFDYNFSHICRFEKGRPLGLCPNQQFCFPVRTRQLAMVTLPLCLQ